MMKPTDGRTKKLRATEKEILHMHKHGMSYGMIASLVGCSRQNVHRIVKYKQHPFSFRLFGHELVIYLRKI